MMYVIKRRRRRRGNTHFSDDSLDELCKFLINKIRNDTDSLWFPSAKRALDVARHILLEHGFDGAAILAVFPKHSLRAEQTAFLGGIPVELNGVSGGAGDDAGVE